MPEDYDEQSSESSYIDRLLTEFGYDDDLIIEDVQIDESWD